MILAKFSSRHVFARPGRTLITLASIVIGVAAVVAVSITSQTTRQAYGDLFTTMTGKTGLEVLGEAQSTFDIKELKVVEADPGVKLAVPLMNKDTVMYFGPKASGDDEDQPKDKAAKDKPAKEKKRGRVGIVVMGVDPARDREVRDYKMVAGEYLDQADGVILEKGFADSCDIEVGDKIRLLTPSGRANDGTRRRGGQKEISVTGLFSVKAGFGGQQAAMMLMRISRAQTYFSGKDEISSIQIILNDDADPHDVGERLAIPLPKGTRIQRPQGQNQKMEETLMSSEIGLHLAGIFSLALAGFIIFNTFLMNVGERRKQMSIMRAIGATRAQLAGMMIIESVGLGVLGTLLGIGLGWVGAYAITQSLQDVWRISMPALVIGPTPFIIAAVFGLGISVVGAVIPAWRAASLSPLEGMRNVVQSDLEGPSLTMIGVGGVLTLGGLTVIIGVIFGVFDVKIAVEASLCLMVGLVLLVPLCLKPISEGLLWLLWPIVGVEGSLAQRQILRHRTRSTLTIGVLFVAAGTGIGMACTILDNVQDVKEWYVQAVRGDFFVRAMVPGVGSNTSVGMPSEVGDEIRAIDGIKDIDEGRLVSSEVLLPKKATTEPVDTTTQEYKQTQGRERLGIMIVTRRFPTDEQMYFDLITGDPQTVVQQLRAGGVVIGSVLANKLEAKVGDGVDLLTDKGRENLKIVGISNEYMHGGLSLYMERTQAEKVTKVEGTDAYIIRAQPEKLEAVTAALTKLVEKHHVLMHTRKEVTQTIDTMIGSVVAGLWGLVFLGFVSASFGVVNTLTMNVLEQTRELGMLRIIAMTRGQVRKAVLTQAGIMAVAGLIPGVAAGVGVAWLINNATMVTIGHPVEFNFRPVLLVGAFAGALALVLVAAMIPATRATRLNLSKALQYE